MKKLRETYNKYKDYIQNDLIMYLGLLLLILLLFIFSPDFLSLLTEK